MHERLNYEWIFKKGKDFMLLFVVLIKLYIPAENIKDYQAKYNNKLPVIWIAQYKLYADYTISCNSRSLKFHDF